MKIIFLVEDKLNLTASNLIRSFNESNHHIDVISYYDDGKNNCKVIMNNGQSGLLYNEHLYLPTDYDAAVLWCWGTASIGRAYLKIFEDQGVFVVNSASDTAITDSKNQLTKKLISANISTPKTLFFDKGLTYRDYRLKLSPVESVLGNQPYVLKPDYGTRGVGIQFVGSINEIDTLCKMFDDSDVLADGFILQEFVGNPDQAISHYRTLVLGDTVFPYVLKITASSPLRVSNIAAGGIAEILPLPVNLIEISIKAAKASRLKIAGVDLMVREHAGRKDPIVALEVNDGPGTKTFDKAGLNASNAVVRFFIDHVEKNIPIAHKKTAT